jgi:hypothetical protein
MEAGMDDVARKMHDITRPLTADEMREWLIPFAEALVEQARRRLGSKMEAYRYVAEANGVSVTWLRKLLSGEPMALYAYKSMSILISFLELCDQLEQDFELERKRIAELKGRIPDWYLNEIIAIRDDVPLDDLDDEDDDEEEEEEERQPFHQ